TAKKPAKRLTATHTRQKCAMMRKKRQPSASGAFPTSSSTANTASPAPSQPPHSSRPWRKPMPNHNRSQCSTVMQTAVPVMTPAVPYRTTKPIEANPAPSRCFLGGVVFLLVKMPVRLADPLLLILHILFIRPSRTFHPFLLLVRLHRFVCPHP